MFLKLYRMTGQIDMLLHFKNDKQMEKLKKKYKCSLKD
jgi:hypothetical protein